MSMKGLPKSVKVGGFTYTVNPNDDFTQGAEVYAAVSDARLEVRIGIEHSTSPLRVRAALLHDNPRVTDFILEGDTLPRQVTVAA